MESAGYALRPTIDRSWLERVAIADPVPHAYARWDLLRYPDRVRFVSAVRGEATQAYLLLWPGRGALIVHYVGDPEAAEALATALPARPFVIVAPEDVHRSVERARGPTVTFPVLMMAARPGPAPGAAAASVRRLLPDDRPALLALTRTDGELVASGYPALDLAEEFVWGAFEDGALAGVARRSVHLPDVWILSGVFVSPRLRGRGLGHALVRAVLADAAAARVTVGLFVREDRPAARTVYDRAGFRPIGRRLWIDAGSGLAP